MSSLENKQEQKSTEQIDEIEISLLDIVLVLVKNKKTILGFTAAVFVLSLIISLLLPNYYTATTKFLPPQKEQSAATAMLSQLGSLTGSATGTSKNPNDIYVGMLKSRTIADSIIAKFKLQDYYDQKYLSLTRKKLEDDSSLLAGKEGILTIEYTHKDPKIAADIANAYVSELLSLTNTLAVTEAAQRRLFYENQLNATRKGLATAEASVRKSLDQGGVAKAEVQGGAMLQATTLLRAQISAKEVQIKAMSNYAADGNTELIRAKNELAAMQYELDKLEGRSINKTASVSDVDSAAANVSKLRDVRYYEILYELLAKQYEAAKIDEAKQASVGQVMDKAIEPDRKSKPKRSLIVMLSTIAAFVLAVIYTLLRNSIRSLPVDSENAKRFAELKANLKWR